jgi:dTDP-4-amino-4,6-dideoxygalactose transaminase
MTHDIKNHSEGGIQTMESQTQLGDFASVKVLMPSVKVLVPKLPEVTALIPYLERIDRNRIYTNYGPLSREFVLRLSDLTGGASVTMTTNGTSAIELALRDRARPGASICLMPSFTFVASAHAVCNAGLVPHFLEVDADTLALTPEIAEAALSSMSTRPAAILVVSAFGAPVDLGAWADFEDQRDIPVVFDAAAALTTLSSVQTQPVCVSLHATKVLGIGEGGAIFSSDRAFTDRVTAMTGFGFVGADRVSAFRGGNYRISEYTAAVGLAALDALPKRLHKLRALISVYRSLLQGKESRLQDGVGDTWSTMTLNVILSPKEVSATITRLNKNQVEWRRWWGMGSHRHPAFADFPKADLSRTDALANRVIGLPFHDGLSEDEIDRVVSCLP